MRILRSEMPAQIFLVPGLGAQGGTAEDVQPAFYNTGKGAIINASRSVIFAGNDLDFDEKAAQAAEATKEAINHVRFANGT
jgi:orotidine-5'-phosphate decarboxylase